MEEIYKKSEIISLADTFIFIYFFSQYLLYNSFFVRGRVLALSSDSVFFVSNFFKFNFDRFFFDTFKPNPIITLLLLYLWVVFLFVSVYTFVTKVIAVRCASEYHWSHCVSREFTRFGKKYRKEEK